MDIKQEQHQQQQRPPLQQQQQQQRSEIEQFLYDVRAYFRASLETSEYENTSNIFHVTAAEETEQLLERCEMLLRRCATLAQPINETKKMNGFNDCVDSKNKSNNNNSSKATLNGGELLGEGSQTGDGGNSIDYMEMSAAAVTKIKNLPSTMASSSVPSATTCIESLSRCSATSDKTFRCSTHSSSHHEVTEKNSMLHSDDEPQIYDICQVVTEVDGGGVGINADGDFNADDETQRAITPDLDLAHAIDCPYMDLPAGHLAIERSTKYGQLQRIEKRLFFDQSKKCYCGVLDSWLLCYADGPTSSKPSTTLHLKSPGIEIEHSGEGKRREICFQITTADPGMKLVFQANNEVDAKEWIHAIEAAIRGDTTLASSSSSTNTPSSSSSIMKLTRKLPTPPLAKKVTFLSGNNHLDHLEATDSIYEEPSPLYDCSSISNMIEQSTDLLLNSTKQQEKQTNLVRQFEYDVPKCPPQPLMEALNSNELETTELLNTPNKNNKMLSSSDEVTKKDFQTKVKDLHHKLSSQLSVAGPNPERLKKSLKKTYSCNANESEAISLTNSPATATKEQQKKQKKTSTSSINSTPSPQKPQTTTTGKDGGGGEKTTKNWFLNRLNKSNNSSNSSTNSNANNSISHHNTSSSSSSSAHNLSGEGVGAKLSNTPKSKGCKQSEKENLLNSLEISDNYDSNAGDSLFNPPNQSSNPTSPCLKGGESKSKVNMIINQFESSGHLATMFSVEALAANALASLTSLCDNDCNNYEPIMSVSTPPGRFMKKV